MKRGIHFDGRECVNVGHIGSEVLIDCKFPRSRPAGDFSFIHSIPSRFHYKWENTIHPSPTCP